VAWLAFSALASQLLLSFGHMHVGQLSGGSAAWAAVERGNGPADVAPSPPQKKSNGLAVDLSAIAGKTMRILLIRLE
jgi:3-mercaptopyruvate sulfurtransferase SseA